MTTENSNDVTKGSSSSVLVTKLNGVTSIQINRPSERNALNQQTIALMTQAFAAIDGDQETRCVILSGVGGKAFCAGADIRELVDSPTPHARREFFNSLAILIERITLIPVPVIAKVEGFALAGGCGLAAACDLTIAADDAVFGLPEAGIGLAALVVMAPLSRVVSKKALTEMVMTGATISAQRALQIGLVSALHPKHELDAATTLLCERLIKNGPHALKTSKQALLSLDGRAEYLELLHSLADQSALLSIGAEASEGLLSFIEKRAPSWRK